MIWFTGLPCSGKTTLANALKEKIGGVVLDADEIRQGLNSDLGFSPKERTENIRRIAEVAKLLKNTGMNVFVAAIAPKLSDRKMAREIIGVNYKEVFCDASLAECKKRDVKGLYARAIAGNVKDFTGISAEYERPENPDLLLKTSFLSIPECLDIVQEKFCLKN